jgi:hypothetical protein
MSVNSDGSRQFPPPAMWRTVSGLSAGYLPAAAAADPPLHCEAGGEPAGDRRKRQHPGSGTGEIIGNVMTDHHGDPGTGGRRRIPVPAGPPRTRAPAARRRIPAPAGLPRTPAPAGARRIPAPVGLPQTRAPAGARRIPATGGTTTDPGAGGTTTDPGTGDSGFVIIDPAPAA